MERERTTREGCMITVFAVRENQTMPACEAVRAVDRQDIVGYGHFEVDTGRVGRRGRPFEDGSDALANGSVRPALFPGTKQPSACVQLEGSLGTQDDRGHLAGPFILLRDPLGPPRPWRHLLPSAAQPFEPVQEFLGAFRAVHNFYGSSSPPHPLNSAFLWWEKIVSRFAQATNSAVKIVNNETEKGKGVHSE